METTMFFPLLLLMCSTSTAQLQTEADSQSLPHGEQTEAQRREPTSASDRQQQACPQDIHAVLREMSASLAEQRVEMRLLQRENEAQAAELIAIKARLKVTENQLEALKRDGQVKQVAFSASLVTSGSITIGPFNTEAPLVFRREVTNIGKAYNPNSGFFTAPVRGAYHFELYISSNGNHPLSGVVLVKNGEHIVIAWEGQASGHGSSANGATLLLEVGDVVFSRLYANTRIFDNYNHHSSFSGHLLFTM